jgi:hypothetical protein
MPDRPWGNFKRAVRGTHVHISAKHGNTLPSSPIVGTLWPLAGCHVDKALEIL